MDYELYLVDRDDHFQAAAAFVAADDKEAVEIAASVQSTCSDVARGYEVWRGPERVAKVRPRSSAYQDMILYELAMKRHDKVLYLAGAPSKLDTDETVGRITAQQHGECEDSQTGRARLRRPCRGRHKDVQLERDSDECLRHIPLPFVVFGGLLIYAKLTHRNRDPKLDVGGNQFCSRHSCHVAFDPRGALGRFDLRLRRAVLRRRGR